MLAISTSTVPDFRGFPEAAYGLSDGFLDFSFSDFFVYLNLLELTRGQALQNVSAKSLT